MKEQQINDYEIEFKTKDNEKIYCSINARIVYDENAKPKHLEGILRNITERKLTEEKIRINEQRFRVAQEVAKIGTFEFDVQKSVYWGSNETKRIFGFDLNTETFPEKKINNCYVNQKKTSALLDDAVKNLDAYNLEYEIFRHGTNERRTINTIAEVERDDKGNPIKVLGLVADITERKRIEKELIEAKEKAQESDRLKSAFLANMSHEIRTPMNGILGFASVLKNPGLSGEKQKIFIDLIEESGARMLNILHEIIDISKIESGMTKVDIHETNINEQIQYVYNLLKIDSEKKGILLSFKNSLPETKARINTDSEKLIGILSNLVKNAIKYTDEGSVEFGYEIRGKYIEFYVRDTGIGIPKSRQKAIFKRFVQADIDDIQARQGAGLGLSIAKGFVELLGGRIWVESEEGKGTTFYFTMQYLPVKV
jgi:signal transduction histidine kinase